MTCCFKASLLLQYSSATIANYTKMKLSSNELYFQILLGRWLRFTDSFAKVRSPHQILEGTQTSAVGVSYSTLSAAWGSSWLPWVTAPSPMLAGMREECHVFLLSLFMLMHGLWLLPLPPTCICTCTFTTVFSLSSNTYWRNSLTVLWKIGWDIKIQMLRNLLWPCVCWCVSVIEVKRIKPYEHIFSLKKGQHFTMIYACWNLRLNCHNVLKHSEETDILFIGWLTATQAK